MKYLGSKKLIAKQLIDAITRHSKIQYGNWVEPMVGGGNMIMFVPPRDPLFKMGFKCYGYDIDKYTIALLNAIKDGWLPPYKAMTKEIHTQIKNNKDKYPDELVAFVGYNMSFGSRFFSAYVNEHDDGRSRYQESINCINDTRPKIKETIFECMDYRDIKLPEPYKTIIYFDPPYKGVTGYNNHFCHTEFYNYCRELARNGYKVYISEYDMPYDFKLIKEIRYRSCLNNINVNQTEYRTEKLFTI